MHVIIVIAHASPAFIDVFHFDNFLVEFHALRLRRVDVNENRLAVYRVPVQKSNSGENGRMKIRSLLSMLMCCAAYAAAPIIQQDFETSESGWTAFGGSGTVRLTREPANVKTVSRRWNSNIRPPPKDSARWYCLWQTYRLLT